MTVLFYRHDAGMPAVEPRNLPAGVTMTIWRPREDGPPPRRMRTPLRLAWWALDRFGAFARHGFAEISIWRGKRLLHRLIVTPRWYRFPFMAAQDLQIGALWTWPEARSQGLARAAVGEAHRRFGEARLWYVVEAGNSPSITLIESCGYRLVGKGRRTKPFGLALLGQFRLAPG